MEVLAPLQAESGIDIRIPEPTSMPDPLLVLDKVSTGYQSADGGSRQILSDVQLMVHGVARIGVLGGNGAGKSTIIKNLAGQFPALARWEEPRGEQEGDR